MEKREIVYYIDTNLPSNLETCRTFFQGSQVSMKQPKHVSQSESIRLGPFSSSFHLMTSSLILWEQLWARSWVRGEELNLGVKDFWIWELVCGGAVDYEVTWGPHDLLKAVIGLTEGGKAMWRLVDIILIFLTYVVCHMCIFHFWCNSRDKNEMCFSG